MRAQVKRDVWARQGHKCACRPGNIHEIPDHRCWFVPGRRIEGHELIRRAGYPQGRTDPDVVTMICSGVHLRCTEDRRWAETVPKVKLWWSSWEIDLLRETVRAFYEKVDDHTLDTKSELGRWILDA